MWRIGASRVTTFPVSLRRYSSLFTPNTNLKIQHQQEGIRLAKYIARCGVCSKRDAEKKIVSGKVRVDGNVIKSLPWLVTASSQVQVDGRVIKMEQPRLWIYHKPRHLLVTHKDPKGRPTLFDVIQRQYGLPRIISIGRLDFDSEGLILLTNDGKFARFMEQPSSGICRTYQVYVCRADGPEPSALDRLRSDEGEDKRNHKKRLGQAVITLEDINRLKKLKDGIEIDGFQYGRVDVEVLSVGKGGRSRNTAQKKLQEEVECGLLRISIYEGKNREIRKIMDHLGFLVNRLKRIQYGPYLLGNLKVGEIVEVILKDTIANCYSLPSSIEEDNSK